MIEVSEFRHFNEHIIKDTGIELCSDVLDSCNATPNRLKCP